MNEKQVLWLNVLISGVSLYILWRFASAAKKTEDQVKGVASELKGWFGLK